jgi:predicted  nucleic acid-binding Zn-ribbon protein
MTLTEDIARAEALESDIAAVRRERDSLRVELVACRAERDRLRLLQDVERAGFVARLEAKAAESQKIAQRARSAEQRAAGARRTAEELTRELAAIRATLSWRLTRPLRAVRRWLPPS